MQLGRLLTRGIVPLFMILPSCSLIDYNEGPTTIVDSSSWNDVPRGEIILGERVEDPFRWENVAQAASSLGRGTAGISPTHIYVRFRPSSLSQLCSLRRMYPVLFDHPLDYEILREGNYYHDPSIGASSPTWQYAVLEKGTQMPSDIEWEEIYSCYIPALGTRAGEKDSIDEVIRESFRLTGFLPSTKAVEGGCSPNGRILLGGVPPTGARVICSFFTMVSYAEVDSEGGYSIPGRFSRALRYRVDVSLPGLLSREQPYSWSISLGSGSPSGVEANLSSLGVEDVSSLYCSMAISCFDGLLGGISTDRVNALASSAISSSQSIVSDLVDGGGSIPEGFDILVGYKGELSSNIPSAVFFRTCYLLTLHFMARQYGPGFARYLMLKPQGADAAFAFAHFLSGMLLEENVEGASTPIPADEAVSEDLNVFRDLYSRGYSLDELFSAFGVGVYSMQQYLSSLGSK